MAIVFLKCLCTEFGPKRDADFSPSEIESGQSNRPKCSYDVHGSSLEDRRPWKWMGARGGCDLCCSLITCKFFTFYILKMCSHHLGDFDLFGPKRDADFSSREIESGQSNRPECSLDSCDSSLEDRRLWKWMGALGGPDLYYKRVGKQ